MNGGSLTIGRLAGAAGVNVQTVRYYQRLGLIDTPPRPLQGYRYYPPETIARLRFIKRAQQLGFSLREIGELLRLGDGRCDDVRRHAEQKRSQIDAQLKDLRTLRRTLDELIHACVSGNDPAHCPIVQTLAEDGETAVIPEKPTRDTGRG